MARPRKFDEGDVLVAARQQFWRHGYDATSMADLCAATGVASQSLYGAFDSKHQLFVRTLEDYCSRQVAGLADSRQDAASPWAWLMAAVTFEDGGRLGLGEDGCYLAGSTAAHARQDEQVRGAARETYGSIAEIFGAALHEADRAGELRPDVDPDEVPWALLAAMQGIEFLRRSGVSEDEFARAKASVITMLTRAYARHPVTEAAT